MVYWFLSVAGAFLALHDLVLPFATSLLRAFRTPADGELLRFADELGELREMLAAGLVPPENRWERISRSAPVWGELAVGILRTLREQGASIAPTLQRLERAARDQRSARIDARTQTAQARAQALLGVFLVPCTAVALTAFLEQILHWPALWWGAVAVAMMLNLLCLASIFEMIEKGSWGDLSKERRLWPEYARCCGEAILASARAGSPPDLAWERGLTWLHERDGRLALLWGASLWNEGIGGCDATERLFLGWGAGLKKILQISILEGVSSAARLESALNGLHLDWKARIAETVSLLATRALRPLFLGVLPSVLGLLILAVGLEVFGAIGG